MPAADRDATKDVAFAQLKPVLLSGLVFPGLGQLTNGHPWRALAFGGSSIALLAVLVRRLVVETLRLLPEDPQALLEPTVSFQLLAELQRGSAMFLLWVTIALVALWIGSMVDAWVTRPR